MFTMTTKAFQLEVAGRMVSHRPCVAFCIGSERQTNAIVIPSFIYAVPLH